MSGTSPVGRYKADAVRKVIAVINNDQVIMTELRDSYTVSGRTSASHVEFYGVLELYQMPFQVSAGMETSAGMENVSGNEIVGTDFSLYVQSDQSQWPPDD